jgi:hypothetical protein
MHGIAVCKLIKKARTVTDPGVIVGRSREEHLEVAGLLEREEKPRRQALVESVARCVGPAFHKL